MIPDFFWTALDMDNIPCRGVRFKAKMGDETKTAG